MKTNTLRVRSSSHTYTVRLSFSISEDIRALCKSYAVHALLDSRIQELYPKVESTLRIAKSVYSIDATEKNKNLEAVLRYTRYLVRYGIKKDHLLLVVGGGMVQDIGSFTSHILLRGISWVFVPTTLLAMGDSCIGSKSGINVPPYKNQVGAFHPPMEVLIHPAFLLTLPQHMIQDGMGEVIKHAIIKGGKEYRRIARNIEAVPSNQRATTELLFDSLRIKRHIVEADEFERGPRRVLNYGHTFGHALEGYTKNRIPHGIAVSIGMDMANAISWRRSMLTLDGREAMSRVIHRNIPYAKLPQVDIKRYMAFIKRDKKIRGDTLYAVLCRGIGLVVISPVAIDRKLEQDIAWYLAHYRAIRRSAIAQ